MTLEKLLEQLFTIAEEDDKKIIYEELNKYFFFVLNQLNIENIYQEVQKVRDERENEKQRVYKKEEK